MKWGLFKANKLFKLVCNKDLKVNGNNGCIYIDKGNDFSMTETFSEYHITIADKAPISFKEFFNIYFDVSDQSLYMFQDFYECFCFLHEIGHIVNNDNCNKWEELKDYRSKTYDTEYDRYKAYRGMKKERLADEYAWNFIKNNKIEIYSIMNGITKEQAKEEVAFWSGL